MSYNTTYRNTTTMNYTQSMIWSAGVLSDIKTQLEHSNRMILSNKKDIAYNRTHNTSSLPEFTAHYVVDKDLDIFYIYLTNDQRRRLLRGLVAWEEKHSTEASLSRQPR
jgi:hypothetical protein